MEQGAEQEENEGEMRGKGEKETIRNDPIAVVQNAGL